MAVGRQDYQAGVVPVKSGYSLSQAKYFDWQNTDVAVAGNEDFCEYTVPAGYELHVLGYRIFAVIPFIHRMILRINAAQYLGREFDTEVSDNFPEGADLVVDAGDTFKIVIYNNDSVIVKFFVMIYGFLEQIES